MDKKYNAIFKIMFCLLFSFLSVKSEEITPYKYKSGEVPKYEIPQASRFTVTRKKHKKSEIVYYFTKPQSKKKYPIILMCNGSEELGNVRSTIHFHRYFLQELTDLGFAVITVEKWGMDGNKINEEEFWGHYTRTQRFKDHREVIDYLYDNPLAGWDGRLFLLGVSEGGPLVTRLTTHYKEKISATVNLCGAGDWNWEDELWEFFVEFRKKWWMRLLDIIPEWLFSIGIPKKRSDYDLLFKEIKQNPIVEKRFAGMTYLYHVDACSQPSIEYSKITIPFLVVAGAKDSIIQSADLFVEKARAAGAPVTYFRVENMDHWIRKHPEVQAKIFKWIAHLLNTDAS